MQCLGVLGLLRQELAVNPFGLHQFACAMMRQARLELLFKCHLPEIVVVKLADSVLIRQRKDYQSRTAACLDLRGGHKGVTSYLSSIRMISIIRSRRANPVASNWRQNKFQLPRASPIAAARIRKGEEASSRPQRSMRHFHLIACPPAPLLYFFASRKNGAMGI
jgi:hypothetical protein